MRKRKRQLILVQVCIVRCCEAFPEPAEKRKKRRKTAMVRGGGFVDAKGNEKSERLKKAKAQCQWVYSACF